MLCKATIAIRKRPECEQSVRLLTSPTATLPLNTVPVLASSRSAQAQGESSRTAVDRNVQDCTLALDRKTVIHCKDEVPGARSARYLESRPNCLDEPVQPNALHRRLGNFRLHTVVRRLRMSELARSLVVGGSDAEAHHGNYRHLRERRINQCFAKPRYHLRFLF